MNRITIFISKVIIPILLFIVFFGQTSYAQETSSEFSFNDAYHNQLYFNRFLINPTYSLVREDKSYLNILHRNEYAALDDNSQNYFIGFSNKLNDNTALGLGIYSQWTGVIREFGFNANYAKSVELGEKSRLTFGTNVSYFNQSLDKNRVIATENDPHILASKKESKIAIQPGITLSIGKFDFGVYAKDLFKYNQTTNEFLTNFTDKNIKASLQYSHTFDTSRGLFADTKIMPLIQVSKDQNNNLNYVGSLLLDLPKYGWLQSTIDNTNGVSMGLGFNINKKMSLGYLLEKDINKDNADLGWNHELSLSYTFKKDKETGAFVENSQDEKIDGIIRNYEEQILQLIAEKDAALNKTEKKSNLKSVVKKIKENISISSIASNENDVAYENRLILDELILRQDSIEIARNREFEKRFEIIVKTVRNDIKRNIKSYIQESNQVENSTSIASNNVTKSYPKYKINNQTTSKSTVTNTIQKNNSRKNYKKLPIKILSQSNINVKSGYYLIANVFKSKKYLNAFMEQLKKQGLDAKEFYNKENGLHYVYLAEYNAKQDAEIAFVSNLNGKYQDEKWVMEVANSSATVANTYED